MIVVTHSLRNKTKTRESRYTKLTRRTYWHATIYYRKCGRYCAESELVKPLLKQKAFANSPQL